MRYVRAHDALHDVCAGACARIMRAGARAGAPVRGCTHRRGLVKTTQCGVYLNYRRALSGEKERLGIGPPSPRWNRQYSTLGDSISNGATLKTWCLTVQANAVILGMLYW